MKTVPQPRLASPHHSRIDHVRQSPVTWEPNIDVRRDLLAEVVNGGGREAIDVLRGELQEPSRAMYWGGTDAPKRSPAGGRWGHGGRRNLDSVTIARPVGRISPGTVWIVESELH